MSIQWSLVLFTLLTGAGGCLFAFIGLNEIVRWSKKDTFAAGIASLALVAVGGLASVTHLSHPDRIMNALSHPTSGIFTEAVLVGIVAVLVVLYLVCIRRGAASAAKVFGAIGGIFGLLLSFMAGYSYIMEAQPAWATILLPLGYLLSALAMGAGLWWALLAPDAENGVDKAVVAAIACSVLALAGIFAYAMVSNAFATAGAIAIGSLACEAVALVLAIVAHSKSQVVMGWAFVVAAVAAALLYRVLMWVLGGGIFGFFG